MIVIKIWLAKQIENWKWIPALWQSLYKKKLRSQVFGKMPLFFFNIYQERLKMERYFFVALFWFLILYFKPNYINIWVFFVQELLVILSGVKLQTCQLLEMQKREFWYLNPSSHQKLVLDKNRFSTSTTWEISTRWESILI